MSKLAAFLTGAAAVPVVVIGGLLIADELETGLRIECRGLTPAGAVCRYDTGPCEETRRIVARARWRWHRIGVHGRWSA